MSLEKDLRNFEGETGGQAQLTSCMYATTNESNTDAYIDFLICLTKLDYLAIHNRMNYPAHIG